MRSNAELRTHLLNTTHALNKIDHQEVAKLMKISCEQAHAGDVIGLNRDLTSDDDSGNADYLVAHLSGKWYSALAKRLWFVADAELVARANGSAVGENDLQ